MQERTEFVNYVRVKIMGMNFIMYLDVLIYTYKMLELYIYQNIALRTPIFLSIELIFLDFHCVITQTGSSDNLNNAR
jgi:hypothetical protein